MSKRKDTPIFRMVVEPGALVPADAYTQERLDTYRHHTVVNVRMTQDIDPPLMRKYWSVLSLAVKQCRTPWRTSDEASDAIKRAFGVVRKQRSASGAEVEEVGSLTDLEGPAFDDFFEGAMALLYRITGVDPETLWKESADPGTDQPATTTSVPDPLAPADVAGNDGLISVEAGGGGIGLESLTAVAGSPGSTESSSATSLDDGVGGGGGGQEPPSTLPPLSSADAPLMRHQNIQGSPDLMEVSHVAVGPPPDGSVRIIKDFDLVEVSLVPGGIGVGGRGALEVDRAVERPTSERQTATALAGTSGPEDGRRDSRESTGTDPDERAMVNSADPLSTRELKQEAIKKVLDLALDGDLTVLERTAELAKNRALWVAKMPGHPQFIKTVFETAAKVMRGELPRPAATKYLFGLKDG